MIYGARIFALLLIAGAMLGFLNTLMAGTRDVSSIISTALFVWCIPAGIALWQGTRRGFKWATTLFALQVPVFAIARLTYEFSTFVSLRYMAGDTTHPIGANLGSSYNIHLLPQPAGTIFGINLIAVIALLYLTLAGRFRDRVEV